MKKRSLIILSATITLAVISAFGLTKNNSEIEATKSNSDADSTKIELSDIGINGGINIDIRTGKKVEFLTNSSKPELNYIVRGYSNRGFHKQITRQKLTQANAISDIIENYPNKWIKDYNSVVISGIGLNEKSEATSANHILTDEQKEVLSTSSEIHIAVHYQKKNYNDETQNRQMNTSFIVIPETQAQYKGGYENMISYLKNNSLTEINAKNLMAPQPIIYFTVNKNGTIENPEISETSGDSDIDNMLLKMLKNMPQWVPAKNAAGENVEQRFALDIGMNGC